MQPRSSTRSADPQATRRNRARKPALPRRRTGPLAVERLEIRVTPSAAPAGVVGWWAGEGNPRDSSSLSNDGATTAVGVSYAAGEVGQAFQLNGGYVRIPGNLELKPSQVSIDGWIKSVFTNRGTAAQRPSDVDTVAERLSAGTYGYGLFVAMDPAATFLGSPSGGAPLGTPAFYLTTTGSGRQQIFASKAIPNDGQFHHVAATYDGATMALWLDGQLVASRAVSGSIDYGSAPSDATIGVDLSTNRISKATVDEVRVFNRALTGVEVQGIVADGTAGETRPAVDTGIVGRWSANGNANDSVDGNNGVPGSATTYVTGVSGQAFSMNGTASASVRVPASTNLNVTSFTMDAWVNTNNGAASVPVLEFNNAANGYGPHLWLNTAASGGPANANIFADLVDVNGNTHILASASGVLHTGSWNHLALTYDYTTGVARIYRNAQVVAESPVGQFTVQTAFPLYFGLRPGGPALNGSLDEVELYRRALSSGEIGTLFDAHANLAGVYGTVTGRVFRDDNTSASPDAAEPGLSGWRVYADLDGNGYWFDGVEPSAVTDANGNYSLGNLNLGTTRIRVVPQGGWTQTTPNPAVVTLTSAAPAATVNVGEFQTATVGGRVFEDLTANGVSDANDPGAYNFTVYLDLDRNGQADAGEPSLVTPTQGTYQFTGLTPGTYRLALLPKPGWTQTTAATVDVTVSASGQTFAGRDFGVFHGVLGGSVFHDRNEDGLQQPNRAEENLSGWTVYLDNNNNHAPDPGEPTAVTDANGNYQFTVLPGTYQVREVLQPFWNQTTADPAAVAVTTSSQASPALDFGDVRAGTVSGRVYEDRNGNGVEDAGEPGLPGWTVYVDYDSNGYPYPYLEPLGVTDANGNYSIHDVLQGTWGLRERPQFGWYQTTPSPAVFTVGPGAADKTGVDLGDFKQPVVRGTVFHDHNANGTRDAGDEGLYYVPVVTDSGRNQVFSNTDGTYEITLGQATGPGTYTISESPRYRWINTTPATLSVTATMSGQVFTLQDFGNFQLATISGTVYEDFNGNGLKDPGDAGWRLRTVYLDANRNGTLDPGEPQGPTGDDGSYTFFVGPGTYQVRHVELQGFTQTTPDPSDITIGSSGQAVTGVDFADAPGAGISGYVFHDDNADGALDGTDGGIANWVVYLDANNDGRLDPTEARNFSRGDGFYAFANLPAGTYHVRAIPNSGWTPTTAEPVNVAVTGLGQSFPNTDFGFTLPTGPGPADLKLDKTAPPAIPGEALTYTLTVTNNGPTDATGVVLVDPLPAGVIFLSAGPGTNYTYASGTVAYHVGALANGATATVYITVLALASTPDGATIDNTGTVTSDNPDPDPDNNQSTARPRASRQADLGLTKTAGDAIAGGQLAYTLTVHNNGPSDASGVVVTDPLQQGVHFISGTNDAGAVSESGGTVTAAVGALPNGATATVTILVSLDSSLPDGSAIDNTATVGGNEPDPKPDNNSATAHTPVTRHAGLRIVKQAPDKVTAGQPLTYTIQVTNLGPSDDAGVGLTDALPAGVHYVSAAASRGNVGGGNVVGWGLGDLAAGAVATLTVVTDVPSSTPEGTVITNTATGSGQYSPPGTGGVSTAVHRSADLGLVKQAPPAVAGTDLVYRLTVANHGPSDASGVIVGDDLPVGVVFVSATSTQGGSYTIVGGTLLYNVGDLPNGASATVSITVHVPPSTADGSFITNTGRVYGSEPDPNPGNDRDTIQTPVARKPDAELVKSAPDEAVAGDTLTYTLTVTNHGPSDASGVVVTDPLPGGETLLSAVASQGTWSGTGLLTFALGDLANGASATLTVVVRVDPSTADGASLTNTATVVAPGDPNPANDHGTKTTVVRRKPDLRLIKTGPSFVIAGDPVTYALAVDNLGPSGSASVTVTDPLPAGVSYVSATASVGTVTQAGGLVTWTIGPMPFGAHATIQLVALVPSTSPDGTALVNTGQVFGREPDPNPGNNQSTARTPVVAKSRLVGQKFNDLNGDGVKESCEPGIKDWTIFLDTNGNGTLDPGEVSTVTDANGYYAFDGLGHATYTVREVQQSGWVRTTANPAPVTTTGADTEFAGGDFGNFHTFRLAGQKFEDHDGNGRKDQADQGLQGWAIFLDANGSGTLDPGEAGTVTDAAGNYAFNDLGPGTYTVREVQQAGWVRTTANPAPVVAASGTDVIGIDFGNFRKVTITGQKYDDYDASGKKDQGEPGLKGWAIFLDANGSGTLDPGEAGTVTDAAGNYAFNDLGPGTYTVREVQQAGWERASANPAPLVVSSGVNVSGIDFGNLYQGTPGKITGGGSVDQKVRNFGFVVQPKTQGGAATFTGNLEFQDKALGYNFHATSITFDRVQPDQIHGWFTGLGTLNGVAGYRFVVWVEDRAEPGAGVDVFHIQVNGPGGFAYDSNQYATRGGVLDNGGNIQVHKPGQNLVAEGSSAGGAAGQGVASLHSAGELLTGRLLVAVTSDDPILPEERARIGDAVATLDLVFGAYGVDLELAGPGMIPDILVRLAPTSPAGGVAEGVLGYTADTGAVTIVQGWDWYLGADSGLVRADQYDFQTILTHELGHALGLSHSGNATSVMFASLAPGVAHRSFAGSDLSVLLSPDGDHSGEAHCLKAEDRGPSPAPASAAHLAADAASRWDVHDTALGSLLGGTIPSDGPATQTGSNLAYPSDQAAGVPMRTVSSHGMVSQKGRSRPQWNLVQFGIKSTHIHASWSRRASRTPASANAFPKETPR